MNHLGILMLDTQFPRPLGDVGHAASFDFPVHYAVVRGASPRRVVRERSAGLLQPFVDAARALVAGGACAISTSCGFLVLFQRELQAALPVPVWTSSLLMLPSLMRPGVLTVDAAALGPDHLRAAGADPATPIEGLAGGCPLQRTLLGNLPQLDVDAARADVVAAAMRLVERAPQVDSIVLECTNLPPYADAVRAATGRSVHDIRTFLHARWASLDVGQPTAGCSTPAEPARHAEPGRGPSLDVGQPTAGCSTPAEPARHAEPGRGVRRASARSP